MPLYEYQCKKCKHRFERIQKFSDPEIKKCPECGGPVERLLSAPAVQFKGSGWYVTDYARKGSTDASSKTEGGKDSGAASASGTDKSGKSESKTSEPKKPSNKK